MLDLIATNQKVGGLTPLSSTCGKKTHSQMTQTGLSRHSCSFVVSNRWLHIFLRRGFDLREELVLKAADQLRLSQDVALHRVLEIALCSSRGKLCVPIQGVESEGVPMNRPGGRTWTAVSDSPAIIRALSSADL